MNESKFPMFQFVKTWSPRSLSEAGLFAKNQRKSEKKAAFIVAVV